MPVFRSIQLSEDLWLGLWNITESKEELLQLARLTDNEYLYFKNLKAISRQKEWLSVRSLINEIFGKKIPIEYQNNEIPIIPNSTYSISISHSVNLSGIIIAGKGIPGMDIEKISPRIHNISRRFISKQEYICEDPEKRLLHLTIHWAAKETLYKMSFHKIPEFKEHMILEPFDPEEEGSIKGKVTGKKISFSTEIQYFKINDYIISWAHKSFE